jgi:hypothetical protein
MGKLIAALAALALMCAPAAAREVRVPETGFPAVTLEILDGWTVQPNPSGMTGVQSPAQEVSMGFIITQTEGTPEDMAIRTEGGTMIKGQAMTVAGLPAYKFVDSRTQEGVTGTMTMVAVVLDAKHIATLNMVTTNMTPENVKAQAEAIIAGVKVVAAPGNGQ